MIYNILSWMVFGLIVGLIARFLVPGQQSMNWGATIVLGVIGSFVGGGISWLLFGSGNGSINPAGLVMSIVGAVVLVLLYSRMTAARSA